MAPVCTACRLSLFTVFVFFLFLCVIQNVKSLLVYDRQALLELRLFAVKLMQDQHEGQDSLPPLLPGTPAFLYRPPGSPHRRKRHRRRGKRGGRLVKLKVCLARSPSAFLAQNESAPHLFASWRSLDPVNSWLAPVVGSDQSIPPPRSCPLHLRSRGVNLRNLRPLARAPLATAALDQAPIRMGLVNARSVTNKTFVLKEFFTSHGLDFLCVTETWISPGESSAFSELLPSDCLYFNSPRSSGRGGGLANVFKSNFNWKQLSPPVSFSSFESSLFQALHSIFFLGKLCGNLSPEDIFPDEDIFNTLKEDYPRPFEHYLTHLPIRSPFSCVLDMIVLQKKTENEEEIKKSLRDIIKDLKEGILYSSTICISQKSKADQNSARYYGVSMSKTCHNGLKKILIAASCLSKWDEYVAGAVMTYCPHNVKKGYFDGTIKGPESIRCEAFRLTDDTKMDPCRACCTLFGFNTTKEKGWDYGNCAEAESLSNLLINEAEVKNHTRVHEYTAESREDAKNQVSKELKKLLTAIQPQTWKKWNNEFYIPE